MSRRGLLKTAGGLTATLALGTASAPTAGAAYQAVGYFKSGAGNGSIRHAVPFLHTDLYSYDGRRFIRAAQYVAKYSLGGDVPFTTYTWGTGQNGAQRSHTAISAASRGQVGFGTLMYAMPSLDALHRNTSGRCDALV